MSDLPTLDIDKLKRIAAEKALEANGGNMTHAAEVLGISVRSLQRWVSRWRYEDRREREKTERDEI